ncbi:GAF domain-containing protein [Actinokineospora iranica]|uniref:GAF domain-containing protein n=1 Tax=Actinokineospora iranica TaxID=1271860 RepID=A0A1G6XGU4_9PSEU|nr:GAF domain-containing protein [Actinokineospora iranica]
MAALDETGDLADRAYFVSGDGQALLGPLAVQFAALTRALLDSTTIVGVLRRVVEVAFEIIPAADLVSVTLRDPDGRFHTPVETDAIAGELDRLQYRFDEGPCVEAAKHPGPASAVSDDLAADPQWPKWAPAAAAHGFCSVLATALLPDSRPPAVTGALNFYSREPAAFTPADRDTALLLATHASLALAVTQAVDVAALQAAHLRRAIDSRDVIGQAKGILMQRRGISADEAYDVLRTTSQQLNVKLADLAAKVTQRFGVDSAG